MNHYRRALFFAALLMQISLARTPIRVLLVTGGHEYDTPRFNAMFASFGNIQLTQRSLKTGTEIFEDIGDWKFDVLALYNKHNPADSFSEKQKRNFLALLDRGVGLLCIHHATNSYPFWPEYARIIGVTYRSPAYFTTNVATFGFPGPLTMVVQDTLDPIMRGIPRTFLLDDEIYGNLTFAPGNKILLATSHPSTNGPLSWTRTYRNAKVFTTLLGHGPGSFDNPNYRKMLANSFAAITPCLNGGGGCITTNLRRPANRGPAADVRIGSPVLPGGFNALGMRPTKSN